MRRPARLLPLITLLLLLAIAALVLLKTGPLVNYVRSLVASELSRELNRDVTIGDAGLTASGRVALRDLLVRNEDGTSLLRVPHVSVQVGGGGGLLSVISGPTDIRSVRLVDPEVTLARLPDGKWSVSDLLERPREGPSRFRGSVEVEGGKITLVDQGNAGLTTSLSDVRISLAYPRPGEAVFTVECGANEGIFDSLELRGRSSSESGATEVDVEADGVIAPYVLERIPLISFGDVRAGEVDLSGEFSFVGGGKEALSYDLLMQLSQVEIAFPWLRRPVRQIDGEVRVREGAVDLPRIVGTLVGAPVTVKGSVLGAADPTLDLEVTASDVQYRQIQALFPEIDLPAALVLPSPLGVTADVTGRATDITVAGEAKMSLIEFRTVPWHDLVMPFEYRRGRLRLKPSASGSPRRFEADVELDLLKPRPAGAGTASLANFPLSMLAAMAGIEGDFEGTVQATVSGEVSADSTFWGTVHATEVSIEGVAIGEMEGDFEYVDEALLLPELRLSGPVATGSLEAEISLGGDYDVRVRLARLDLSAIGAPLDLRGLRGQCCARLEASGHVGDGIIAGYAVLGPGELQGRHFDSLSGEFSVSQERFAVDSFDLSLEGGRGAGEFVVDNWKGPRKRAPLSGRVEISEVDVSTWLPAWAGSASPTGLVSGSVGLAGTLADPEVDVDLLLESLSIAGQPLGAGELQARYAEGRFAVERGRIDLAGGELFISGGYAPEIGFSLELAGDNIQLEQLTASWRSQLGLTLTGGLAAKASLKGPLARPELRVRLDARPLSVNQEEFDELVVEAGYGGSMVSLDSVDLRRGESALLLSGTIGTDDGSMAAHLELEKTDIGTLTAIASRTAYRLAQAGGDERPSSFVQGYSTLVGRLTRLPEGSLTADVKVSGSIRGPQIEVVSFALDEAAFDGVEIDHIEGGVKAQLRGRRAGGLVLESVGLNLAVKHGLAEASLVGDLSAEQGGELKVGVDDLNLQLLDPSLPLARLEHGSLTLTALPLAGVPAQALDQGLLRIGGLAVIPRADLHLESVSFAPLTGMDPVKFNADVHLRGNRVLIELIEDATEEGDARPGVPEEMGSGTFSVDGYAEIAHWHPKRWEGNQFDIRLSLSDAQLALPGIPDVKINGSLSLTTDPTAGGALLTTRRRGGGDHDALVVSDAVLGVPEVEFGEPHGVPFFSPALDVMVLVGDDVSFHYGSTRRPTKIEVTPGNLTEEGEPTTGYLHVTGTATAEGVELDGKFESREGDLAFPNGTLKLQEATAEVSRNSGESPVIVIKAAAAGRVGDYYVSLRPSGQVFPYDADLIQLNATSIPLLEEGFVLALLGGTVVAPSRESQADLAGLLRDPTRVQGRGGQVEGVMVPAFSSTSGSEVGVDLEASGQMRLRLAQRLSERFAISYVSSLGGAGASYTLRFTYQITDLWSVGRAVDELEQGRWEVQAFIPF